MRSLPIAPLTAPPLPAPLRRCQQDGRVMGGIGSVPGFGWWPIKAYRECPQASKRGIAYRRCETNGGAWQRTRRLAS